MQRLAGITEAGRHLGVAVILLGGWPHGTTCYITADGLISGVMPPEAALAGTEAYRLAAADLAAIIAQLDEAREIPGDDGPAAPGPPETGQPHLLSATAAPEPGQATAPRRPGQQPPPAGAAGQGAGPGPAGTLVRISVLGPLQITADGREIGTGLRKARELLAFLTVHGAGGATGEAISEALWPGPPPGHGTRQRNVALREACELLRGATGLTTPMWINLTADRYRLDPALTDADLWRFQAALEAARIPWPQTGGESVPRRIAGTRRRPEKRRYHALHASSLPITRSHYLRSRRRLSEHILLFRAIHVSGATSVTERHRSWSWVQLAQIGPSQASFRAGHSG